MATRRTTRASAAKDAAAITTTEAEKVREEVSAQLEMAVLGNQTLSRAKKASANDKITKNTPLVSKTTGKKRKRPVVSKPEEDADELPHNMGKAFIAKNANVNGEQTALKEEEFQAMIETVDKATTVVEALEASKSKKARRPKAHPYGLTPGISPFPDWPYPTLEQCQQVTDLLSTVHGVQVAPATIPVPSLTVSGCGEVPSILDAMIRTLLSAATTGTNSSRAFQGLVDKFGILDHGIGKGSVNWDAVRRADQKDIFEAIKSGGLAALKSKNIKAILEMVYAENQARRAAIVQSKPEPESTLAPKNVEVARADEHVLSLDHFHTLSSQDAMLALTAYPGIGVKTASCVLLFCMRRPSFAVDTHVFRLLKWLRWIPPTVKSEVVAFRHVEVRVPDELKYALHQLFIKHGKICGRCRAATGEGSEGWAEGCVIEDLVERTGKRKGKGGPGKNAGLKWNGKGLKGKKAMKEDDEDEDDADDGNEEPSDDANADEESEISSPPSSDDEQEQLHETKLV